MNHFIEKSYDTTSLPGEGANVKPGFVLDRATGVCFSGDRCRIRRNDAVISPSILEDYTKNPDALKKLLTTRERNARIHSKLNRLIEARYSSVPSGKVVQPPKGKGITAEVWEICPGFSCWVVREYLPDCHKNLCEALSLAVRIILFLVWVFRISMDRFPKRFIFLFQNAKTQKERLILK